MVRGVCRAACGRASASRASSRALTRHHLALGFLVHERPARRAVRSTATCAAPSPVEVEVTLLSCADRLATRGRKADEATRAHLELARELMGAALDWREHGPPRLPIRGDELARELDDRARPGARPADRASWPRPPTPARSPRARRRSSWRVGCARDRRLRGLRGRAAARRRASPCTRRSRRVARPVRSPGSGSTSPPRTSSSRSARSSTCTSSPSRTRSTPTSAPSSRSTATWSSSSSRRPATSTPRRSSSSARS